MLSLYCSYCSYMITKFKYEQNCVERQNTQLLRNITIFRVLPRLSLISFTCERYYNLFYFFLHFHATPFRSNAYAFLYEAKTCVLSFIIINIFIQGKMDHYQAAAGSCRSRFFFASVCEIGFLFANVPLQFRSFCESIFCWSE